MQRNLNASQTIITIIPSRFSRTRDMKGRKGFIIALASLIRGFLSNFSLDFGSFIPNRMSESDVAECKSQFSDLSSTTHPDVGSDIEQILTKHGYPNEEIIVQTPDGYLLSVFYIPSKLPRNSTFPEPVLLVHGMGANGFVFLIQASGRNLVTMLADQGFDVFILNNRGTKYSFRHTELDPETDYEKYWNFSFHEMGVQDLPAVINAITKRTGQFKIRCIAYSLGTTMVTALLSELPEFNERFKSIVFLSTTVYLQNVHWALKLLTTGSRFYLGPLNYFLHGKLDAKAAFRSVTGTDLDVYCATSENVCSKCVNMIFSRYGHDGGQINYSTIPLITSGFPDLISLKTHVHVQQLVKSGKFCQFDYGFESENARVYGTAEPPCYKLGNIRTPITIFWGQNDNRSPPEDATRFWNELNPEARGEFLRVRWDRWNHVDFVVAKDADTFVYDAIVKSFKT